MLRLCLISSPGLYESQTQVAQLIKEVDQNANGRIEFNEFVDIVAHVRSGKSSGFAKVSLQSARTCLSRCFKHSL